MELKTAPHAYLCLVIFNGEPNVSYEIWGLIGKAADGTVYETKVGTFRASNGAPFVA